MKRRRAYEPRMTLETLSSHRCFGGVQTFHRHASAQTRTPMRFSVFAPPHAETGKRPVLFWLSGLTCTEENFTTKAGAQRVAAELGLIIVAPDTSPRGEGVPDDPDGAYDFGLGAGFYVDAVQAPWNAHYRMHAYIAEELPALIAASIPAADMTRLGVFGHSMGGHGALIMALKHPELFKSVSAFAPIVAPTQVPWGEKAFSNYLGPDRETWRQYDACALIERGARTRDTLVDQGTADQFLDAQLKPHLLERACAHAGIPLTLRMQSGYDHSYYFMASFIGDHLRWHADRLS